MAYWTVLYQISVSTSTKRPPRHLFVMADRKYHQLRGIIRFPQFLDDFQTVQLGHLQVDEGEIRRERPNHLHRCKAVGTLSHDLELRLSLTECNHAFSHNGMIVCQHD